MKARRRFPHVAAVDDAPFPPRHRGDVLIVGTVFAGLRLEGVLSARVRRDGANATRAIAAMIGACRFAPQLHLVLLQGITFAGFNVVDLPGLSAALGLPVLSVSRKEPDLAAIRRALLEHVAGGKRKWRLIERAGPVEKTGGVYVQRAGLSPGEAAAVIESLAARSRIPEPLRAAHLIASGIAAGASRQRV